MSAHLVGITDDIAVDEIQGRIVKAIEADPSANGRDIVEALALLGARYVAGAPNKRHARDRFEIVFDQALRVIPK